MRAPVALLAAATLSLAAPAFADTPRAAGDPVDVAEEAARAGGDEGLRHFAAGRLLEAYAAFQRADALYHAPTLVLYMAHSQKRLGKLAAARALYRKVADERLPKRAPLQFFTAQAVAREELEHLERRVPFVDLTLTGGSLPVARLTVDGHAAPVAAWQLLPLDPGDHVLEVRVGEGAALRRAFNLKEGATLPLALTLPEAPPRPPAVVVAPPVAEPTRAAPARGPLAPALVAFGAGAAALVVGAATGAASLGQIAELRARCGADRSCPASAQPLAASAGRLADASTIAFVAGGAALATGVVLLVLRPGREAQPSVQVGLGLRSALIAGRF